MNYAACLLVVVTLPGMAVRGAPAKFDTPAIEHLTGVKGVYNQAENVFKISLPRTDVKVTVDQWAMPPFMGGGSMIRTVTEDGFTPALLPAKFEAGTPDVAGASILRMPRSGR